MVREFVCNLAGASGVSISAMDEDIQELLGSRRNARAFELLVDRYQKKVFHLAFSILKETAKAEEAAQDVFLKLWQVLDLYDGRAALSTWVYTIARNRCLTLLRAESYRKALPFDECEAHLTAADTVERAELAQCLERLPEVQREVITLFYLQERSVQEVAQMLDLAEGTVKSHLHRARRALAEMMRSEDNELSRCTGPVA